MNNTYIFGFNFGKNAKDVDKLRGAIVYDSLEKGMQNPEMFKFGDDEQEKKERFNQAFKLLEAYTSGDLLDSKLSDGIKRFSHPIDAMQNSDLIDTFNDFASKSTPDELSKHIGDLAFSLAPKSFTKRAVFEGDPKGNAWFGYSNDANAKIPKDHGLGQAVQNLVDNGYAGYGITRFLKTATETAAEYATVGGEILLGGALLAGGGALAVDSVVLGSVASQMLNIGSTSLAGKFAVDTFWDLKKDFFDYGEYGAGAIKLASLVGGYYGVKALDVGNTLGKMLIASMSGAGYSLGDVYKKEADWTDVAINGLMGGAFVGAHEGANKFLDKKFGLKNNGEVKKLREELGYKNFSSLGKGELMKLHEKNPELFKKIIDGKNDPIEVVLDGVDISKATKEGAMIRNAVPDIDVDKFAEEISTIKNSVKKEDLSDRNVLKDKTRVVNVAEDNGFYFSDDIHKSIDEKYSEIAGLMNDPDYAERINDAMVTANEVEGVSDQDGKKANSDFVNAWNTTDVVQSRKLVKNNYISSLEDKLKVNKKILGNNGLDAQTAKRMSDDFYEGAHDLPSVEQSEKYFKEGKKIQKETGVMDKGKNRGLETSTLIRDLVNQLAENNQFQNEFKGVKTDKTNIVNDLKIEAENLERQHLSKLEELNQNNENQYKKQIDEINNKINKNIEAKKALEEHLKTAKKHQIDNEEFYKWYQNAEKANNSEKNELQKQKNIIEKNKIDNEKENEREAQLSTIRDAFKTKKSKVNEKSQADIFALVEKYLPLDIKTELRKFDELLPNEGFYNTFLNIIMGDVAAKINNGKSYKKTIDFRNSGDFKNELFKTIDASNLESVFNGNKEFQKKTGKHILKFGYAKNFSEFLKMDLENKFKRDLASQRIYKGVRPQDVFDLLKEKPDIQHMMRAIKDNELISKDQEYQDLINDFEDKSKELTEGFRNKIADIYANLEYGYEDKIKSVSEMISGQLDSSKVPESVEEKLYARGFLNRDLQDLNVAEKDALLATKEYHDDVSLFERFINGSASYTALGSVLGTSLGILKNGVESLGALPFKFMPAIWHFAKNLGNGVSFRVFSVLKQLKMFDPEHPPTENKIIDGLSHVSDKGFKYGDSLRYLNGFNFLMRLTEAQGDVKKINNLLDEFSYNNLPTTKRDAINRYTKISKYLRNGDLSEISSEDLSYMDVHLRSNSNLYHTSGGLALLHSVFDINHGNLIKKIVPFASMFASFLDNFANKYKKIANSRDVISLGKNVYGLIGVFVSSVLVQGFTNYLNGKSEKENLEDITNPKFLIDTIADNFTLFLNSSQKAPFGMAYYMRLVGKTGGNIVDYAKDKVDGKEALLNEATAVAPILKFFNVVNKTKQKQEKRKEKTIQIKDMRKKKSQELSKN